MRLPWHKKPTPPAIQKAEDAMDDAAKATDAAAKAVRDYWAARAPQRDYAYAERRRMERRHR